MRGAWWSRAWRSRGWAAGIALLLCGVLVQGCRQVAGYATAPERVVDAGLDAAVDAAVDGGLPTDHGAEDPPPPLLPASDRPYYVVSLDRVGQRLPLFRDPVADELNIRSVYGSDKLGWWAVGDGGWIVHNPGDGFRRVQTSTLPARDYEAVWASGVADIWVGGATYTGGSGTWVANYRGNALNQRLAPGFTGVVTGIRGSGPDDIWFSTTSRGQLLHWEDNKLKIVNTSIEETHARPWVDANGRPWIAVTKGVAHYDGVNWPSDAVPGLSDANYHAIFSFAQPDFFLGASAQLVSWIGGQVTSATVEAGAINAIWGRPDEVWAVGDQSIFLWDGASWSEHWRDDQQPARTFFDLTPAGAQGTYVAASQASLLRHHPAQQIERWRTIPLGFSGSYRALASVGAVGQGGVVWIASGTAVLRERGWGIERLAVDPILSLQAGVRELRAGFARSAQEVWFVGDAGLVARWDASSQRIAKVLGPSSTSSTNLLCVWVGAEGDVWVGGGDRTIHRRDHASTNWGPAIVGTSTPRGLWGDPAAGLLYAATNTGLDVLSLGDGTKRAPLLQGESLQAVHGHGDEVWAVGGGKVWRRVGTAVPTLVTEDVGENYRAVYVPPSGSVWIAGDDGKLKRSRLQRTTFQAVDSGTSSALWSLHGSGEEDVWIGGADVLLHYPDMPPPATQ